MTKINFIKILLFFSFLLFFDNVSYSQESIKFDSNLIEHYKFQISQALLHYPELQNTKIEFRYKSIKTTLLCRPKILSIFLPPKKRSYVILINIDSSRLKNAILDCVPYNAQIGVFGHEFGHIIDYQNKRTFGIIKTGIGYLFKNSKSNLEKKVDRIAINHGLKKELEEFIYFILNESNAPEKYKNFKRKIYYSPQQLDLL